MELAPVTTGNCYEQLRVIPDEKEWCSVITVSVSRPQATWRWRLQGSQADEA